MPRILPAVILAAEQPALTTLSFDLEVVAAAFVPVGALALLALSSGNQSFRRAALKWFIPLSLVWFAPCWLTSRSPVAFDLLEAYVVPWIGPAAFEMQGNGLLADVPLQFVPWREITTESWRSGEPPFLNRYAGAGSPLWANPQAAVLAPATILGLAFSSFAWPLFAAMLRLLTALCGMYLLMRHESASHTGALVAAIAWGFGAGLTAFALFPHANVVSLLPLLLLVISRTVEKGGVGTVCSASIVLALMFLGGHPETVLHSAVVAIPWALRAVMRLPGKRARGVVSCVAFGLVGIMLAAPVVLPFALQLGSSERVARLETQASLGAAPRLTLDNVVPFVLPAHFFHTTDAEWDGDNFTEVASQYVGLLSLILAIVAFVAVPRTVRFWFVLFVVCFPLAYQWTGIELLARWMPWFDDMLHGRIRLLLALAIAAAAGHGFDAVAAKVEGVSKSLAIVTGTLLSLTLLVVLTHVRFYAGHATLNHVLIAAGGAGLTAGVFIWLVHRNASLRVVPLLLAVDLAASLIAYNAPVSREHFYPTRPSLNALADENQPTRVLGLGGALIPNTGAMVKLEQLGVNDPMAFEPFVALLRSAGYDTRYYFNRFDRVPPQTLLDFLGVSRIIAKPGRSVGDLSRAYDGSDAVVIDNPTALPRYFVPDGIGTSPDPLDSFKKRNDATFVWIEGGDGESHPSSASVSLLEYRRIHATLEVVAEAESFIASSEVALPGWNLERNGRAWPLTRVNGLFLGWSVPPGRSTFRMTYRPPGLSMGLILSLVAAACMIVWRLAELMISRRARSVLPG